MQGFGVRERLGIFAWVGSFAICALFLAFALVVGLLEWATGFSMDTDLWLPAGFAVIILSGLIAPLFDRSAIGAVVIAFFAVAFVQGVIAG